jgi:transposase
MVYRSISKDIRERVLWLISHDYVPADICEIFGISLRSLQRWKRNQHLYGTLLPPHLPVLGRPRILNTDMTHDLYTLMEEAPEMYLDEIQDWIAVTHDVKLSKTALFENIRDAGITYKLLRKAAAERDDDARAEWMDEMNTHFVSQQLVFVDETSKDDRTIYRHYGRAPAGRRATIHANFVRGDRYSMVAALSLDGYEAVRIVPGSVDSTKFLDFIVQDLVSTYYHKVCIVLTAMFSFQR